MDFVFEIKKEFFILEKLDDSAAKDPRESLSLNGPENGENASIKANVRFRSVARSPHPSLASAVLHIATSGCSLFGFTATLNSLRPATVGT
jgi:hypothetical protein